MMERYEVEVFGSCLRLLIRWSRADVAAREAELREEYEEAIARSPGAPRPHPDDLDRWWPGSVAGAAEGRFEHRRIADERGVAGGPT